MQPLLLGSNVRDDNTLLTVDLTNPDMYFDEHLVLPKDTLHVVRTIFLWRDTAYQRLAIRNHGDASGRSAPDACCSTAISPTCSRCAACAASAAARMQPRGGAARHDRAELSRPRRVDCGRPCLRFDPPPDASSPRPRRPIALDACAARGHSRSSCTIGCGAPEPPKPVPFLRGLRAVHRDLRAVSRSAATVETSNDLFNEVLCRSMADLDMLMTDTPQGPLSLCRHPLVLDHVRPRRDHHRAADAVARSRASRAACCAGSPRYQAKTDDPASDAEPGKILHEMRGGEMAALGEVPFGLYYGSVDCDAAVRDARRPLCRAHRRRRDASRELWPAIEAALAWIDGSGDPDGDGFVEYYARDRAGPRQPGLEGFPRRDLPRRRPPGRGPDRAGRGAGLRLRRQAAGGALRARGSAHADARTSSKPRPSGCAERFEARFWCAELGTYALALDGEKEPCRVRTSNAGQVLFTGIAAPERAAQVGRRPAAAAVLLRLGHPHGRRAARRATTRCRITTARSGRTTTR